MSIKGENFKIMVGGQVIGTAKSGMLTYLDTVEKAEEPKHEEFNKSWDISCNALVSEGDIPNPLKDMMRGPQLVNVKIERPIGKMPRKMKKAHEHGWLYCRDTKWKRKAGNYRRRMIMTLHDAEIVITKQDQETLTATITKAMEKDAPCARVSGEDFKRALDRYSSRQSRRN